MKNLSWNYDLQSFRKDFMASMVVFLVALPLCMGIALASGVPPILGLISGIIGGLIIAPVTGAPFLVSGPAAGLAVMVFQYVESYGLPALVPLGLVVGLFQFGAGFLKLGNYFKAVSPALIKGMLAGIGLLILVSQVYVGFNASPVSSGLQNIAGLPNVIIQGISSEVPSMMILLISMAVLLVWAFAPKRVSQIMPASLLAVIVGSIAAGALFPSVQFVSIPENLLQELNMFSFSAFSGVSVGMILSALGIAFVASVETLLSATAVDKLAKKGSSNNNQELFAQGLGNAASGMLGALPMTGVIVRSTANVDSGAQTRVSAILHGLWLFLFVFFVPQLLMNIPLSALAAILIFVGWKLMDVTSIPKLFKESKSDFLIYAVTVSVIVAVDLLTGVIAGFVVSLLVLLKDLISFNVEKVECSEEIKIQVAGHASFLHIPKLTDHLPEEMNGKKVTVDLRDARYIDTAVKEQLQAWVSIISKDGKKPKVMMPERL